MNDTELDELLDRWNVPGPSQGLRENVRAEFLALEPPAVASGPVGRRSFHLFPARRLLLAAATVIAGFFVFSFAQALSQTTPPFRVPFTVDSEFTRYAEDGRQTVEMLATSYTGRNGGEVILSRSIYGSPVGTVFGRVMDAALPAWQRFITPFAASPEDIAKVRKRRRDEGPSLGVVSGCANFVAWGFQNATCLSTQHWYFPASSSGDVCLDGAVVGSETILNYATKAVYRLIPNHRLTLWTAPSLGCFALRISTEEKRPDGSYRLVQSKQALKVTLIP